MWNGSNADSIKDGGVVPSGSADGWTAATGTWTYSSADAPTYVISVNADMTTTIGAGQRIKLTDSGTQYFIVTAVGVFGGGVTLITVYGGTDYVLSGGAITSPYYSLAKAPFGFPLSPSKWTQEYRDTTARSQATPTINVWYNINTASLSIPIGIWRVYYQVFPLASDASDALWPIATTLSTANNSSSDADWDTAVYISGTFAGTTVFREKIITLAAKTTYYLNTRTTTGAGLDTLYNANDSSPLIIRAVCAYL